MLRITLHPERRGERRLVLEGRLAGAWVSELRRVAIGSDGPARVALDLSALTYADADGLALLRELLDGPARLERASAFVSALLGGTP
jgi:anti-anti-sigma regulatory factor